MNTSISLSTDHYRVGFLALNPPSHLFHLLPIAFELSKIRDVSVILYYSTNEIQQILEKYSEYYPGNKCEFVHLKTSIIHRLFRLFKRRPHPRVRHVIAHNLPRLLSHHALVMTDKHMLKFKTADGPICICADHGAGDRQYGFSHVYKDFDFILFAGHAKRDRMLKAGIADKSKGKIVGYPKFDPPLQTSNLESLFSNNNPIVIYAPHFNANETSWYEWGLDVLEYFYQNPDFNLIFAPHVMLFAKRHPKLPEKYLNTDNIHIDYDSIRLSDMSYTKTADIYLGDVSSQIYEFIGYKIRPCVFLNPHHVSWQGKDDFRMWQTGKIVEQIDNLDLALRTATEEFSTYRAVQEKIVEETFAPSPTSPGKRAAKAISDFLVDQGFEKNSLQNQ